MENNSKEIVLEFDLKDFEEKDVKVHFSSEGVEIKAERNDEKKEHEKDFSSVQRLSSNFNYSSTLPPYDPNKVEKSFKKGILKLTIPRLNGNTV